MKTPTSKTVTSKTVKQSTKKPARKTTRVSHLSKSKLHAIYAPAAKIAWVTIFTKRAKASRIPAERKAYLAKAKAQLSALAPTVRKRYFELQRAA